MLAARYFETIDGILRRFEEEQPRKIVTAARMIVDSVLAGGRFWIYDKHVAVASEVTGRAGGLMMVQGLGASDLSSLKKGDVVLIAAERNDDPDDRAVAEKAKGEGARTVAVLPFGNPADAAERLQHKVDLALDDYAEHGDGCLEARGLPSKICPTSGVVNAAIAWAVCAEVVDELRRRAKEANIYKSMFRVGSDEWNARMREEFARSGY